MSRTSEYSLAGRYLSAPIGDSGHVRIWNLKTGRQFDRAAPTLTEWRAAAPHGFLVAKFSAQASGIQELETVSLSGTIKSLGSPFPQGNSYGVTVNSRRYIAYRNLGGSKPWGAKTATFAHPSRVTTLIDSSGRGPSSATTYCGVPNARLVACDTEAKHWRLQVYSLGGKLIAHTNKYDADFEPTPVVLGASTIWLNRAPNTRLQQLTASGSTNQSSGRFAPDGPVRAFHRIVVGKRGRTALLELESATSKPEKLIGVKN